MTFSPDSILIAFLGGLIPALVWLWFWLREDRANPEPRRLILYTFLGGAACVPLVLPFEHYAAEWFSGVIVIVLWAALEEIFKFEAANLTSLRRCNADEPIDMVMYMITVALGFSALENAFFLFDPVASGNLVHSVLTGNLRFFGATLLHVLSSATVGVALALAFYKPAWIKRLAAMGGLILAIVLHTLFNFFIIQSNGATTFLVFAAVWVGIIILILVLEKIKRIRKPRTLIPS